MTKRLPKGIRLRGNKYFVDVTVDGKRKTATCDTLAEAVARQEALKEALLNGVEINANRANSRVWTLQEALDVTLDTPAKEGWKGSAWERKGRVNVEDAIRFMGAKRPLDTINLNLIEEWIKDCDRRGNGDSTINRKVSALRKVMTVAHNRDGLPALPKFPKHRRENNNRIRQVSLEEEHELLNRFTLMGEQWMADIVTVLIDTGMRCSELLNIWKQDFERGERGRPDVLLVYGEEARGTKNGTYRSVPLTKRSSDVIRRCSAATTGIKVFDTDYDTMRRTWDTVRAHMGLADDPHFTLHVLRHTCVSRLVRKGIPMPVVQKWAGHKRIETTQRYAHLYPSDLFAGVGALESYHQPQQAAE